MARVPVQIQAPPITNHISLAKLLNLSGPRFHVGLQYWKDGILWPQISRGLAVLERWDPLTPDFTWACSTGKMGPAGSRSSPAGAPSEGWCCAGYTLTWSWTSSSHNSSCMMRSNGRKRASLKWKWGGSFQSVSTSVSISWMKETAFWDTCLSLWQAACKIHRRVQHPQDFRQLKTLVPEGFPNPPSWREVEAAALLK